MEMVLSAVLPDVPLAAIIWLALLAAAAVTVGVLVTRPGRVGQAIGGRIRRAALPPDGELADEAREAARYAQEVAVAAERAAATAQRRRAEWLAAQEAVETAWQAYVAAENAVRRLDAATALPLPHTPQTPAEYADRERYLHRTALDAYWRRELTVEQLSDVFAHRDGWDPRLHPVQQELVLLRVIRDNLLARQQAAAEAERAAWQVAELAMTAAQSLRDEAFAAAQRADHGVRPEQALADQLLAPPAEPVTAPLPTLAGVSAEDTAVLPVIRPRPAVPQARAVTRLV